MPATGSAAYGMYTQNTALPDIVCTLSQAGFNKEHICMVLSPAHPMACVVRDARFIGATSGEDAAGARTIGWFSQFGAVVIPEIGFFVRSQAFLHALLAEQPSLTLFGGSRVLAGLGMSQEEAKRVHHAMADAGALLFVACTERARAEWAVELLWSTGARGVASLGVAEDEAANLGHPFTLASENPVGCNRALAVASS